VIEGSTSQCQRSLQQTITTSQPPPLPIMAELPPGRNPLPCLNSPAKMKKGDINGFAASLSFSVQTITLDVINDLRSVKALTDSDCGDISYRTVDVLQSVPQGSNLCYWELCKSVC